MNPTVGYIQSQWAARLDDPLMINWTADIFQAGFNEAYDCMFSTFLMNEIPRILQIVQGISVPPNTLSMTPAQMGISGFGGYSFLKERPFGSNLYFIEMDESLELPQRPQYDRLLDFVFRNGTFYFVGATSQTELQIEYESSEVAPTALNTQIMVDSCANFLVNYTIGVTGQRKGQDALAQECMLKAVGPRFNDNIIGGMLGSLVRPLVRNMQSVRTALRPYSAGRRQYLRRAVPFIAAQQGTTGGSAQLGTPIQYSSVSGGIIGAINNVNRLFWVNCGSDVSLEVFRNGVLQTLNYDYTVLGNQITFSAVSTPQTGDIITVEATFGTIGVVSVPSTGINTVGNTSTASLIGTMSLTPGVINDGAVIAPGTISVTGAQINTLCAVVANPALPPNVLIIGANVSASNTVSFWIFNSSGLAVNIGATTFTAICSTKLSSTSMFVGTATLTPGVVNDGSILSPGAITVVGAQANMLCTVGASPALPTNVLIVGAMVSDLNTVMFSVFNSSGGPVNIGSTIFTAVCSSQAASAIGVSSGTFVGTATFTPGIVNDGAVLPPGAVTVSGAQVNMLCAVVANPVLPPNVIIIGATVTTLNTVTFSIFNSSGFPVNLGMTTFTAICSAN